MSANKLYHLHASSIEEYGVSNGLTHTQTQQVSKGKLSGEWYVYTDAQILVGKRCTNVALVERGKMMEEYCSISFHNAEKPCFINGRTYEPGYVHYLPPNSEYTLITPETYSHQFIGINEYQYKNFFCEEEQDQFKGIVASFNEQNIKNTKFTDAATGIVARLREITYQYSSSIPSLLLKDIQNSVAQSILHLAESSFSKIGRANNRMRVVVRAIEYLSSSNLSTISLMDIAKAAHVSQRTLEYAFQNCLGLTAKTYLKHARLNAIRSEILRTDQDFKLIAPRYGINHLGRFSQDYLALFGEYPSQTRKR